MLTGAMAAHHHVSLTVSAAEKTAESVNWSAYGGANNDAQYSPLKQIDRTNASKLQQVWFYPVGNGTTGGRFGSKRPCEIQRTETGIHRALHRPDRTVQSAR